MSRIELGSMLENDPNHRDGRPFIAGTRVSVDRIGILFAQGSSPAEIAERYSLDLPQVFAALAYYLANREQIDREIESMDAEYDRRAAAWAERERAG
ncbi:MAG: DUF433 domain-containing protein [Dehalococcoidia bacterium]